MTYFEKLEREKEEIVRVLRERKVNNKYLKFAGPGEPPSRAPRVPTDVRSEFLANRAMGDWAEKILASAISDTIPQVMVSHYGSAETISAGEEGFKEFYLSGVEEVRKFGKRPDLLIFSVEDNIPQDISSLPLKELDQLVGKSLIAIEVRSSKFEAQTYMRVRDKERTEGKRNAKATPSFTVKVEDLKIVYRWIERHQIQQYYFQVFFDSVYAIDVLDIFRIIGTGEGFTIDTPEKSQLKATIMIPITSGVHVGNFEEMPEFTHEEKVTRLGRHDAYVKPMGGTLILDDDKLRRILTLGE